MSCIIRSGWVFISHDTIPAAAPGLQLSAHLQKNLKVGLEVWMWYLLKFSFWKLRLMGG